MRQRKNWSALLLIGSGLIMLVMQVGSLGAQDSAADATLRLYVDPKTHIVYTQPGRGRHLLAEIPASALSGASIEQQQKTEAQLHENQQQISALIEKNDRLELSNQNLAQQMAEIRPAWRSYIENFQDKFQLGTLVYGNYRFYTHTGFQPQELTQVTNPGPGNNAWSSFDITRAYLNFFFRPTKDWTMRITPNIYKTIGSVNDKIGQVTAFGSNLDGDLGYRLKYAQLQYNSLWRDVPTLKDGTISMGEIPNPLVSWQEDLYGFRYVNLTPWNYLGLSSTQLGLSMEGPINIRETKYADYGLGVYNNSSFHAFEQSNSKQVMTRVSIYPFGSDWRFQGLGITGFYNYGYGNTTPDTAELPTVVKGPNSHITRVAALLHYAADQLGLAGEFDYGNNAFSSANLFSGIAPADEFGFPTGPQLSTPQPWNSKRTSSSKCYSIFNTYGPQPRLTMRS